MKWGCSSAGCADANSSAWMSIKDGHARRQQTRASGPLPALMEATAAQSGGSLQNTLPCRTPGRAGCLRGLLGFRPAGPMRRSCRNMRAITTWSIHRRRRGQQKHCCTRLSARQPGTHSQHSCNRASPSQALRRSSLRPVRALPASPPTSLGWRSTRTQAAPQNTSFNDT
jgi:hypothetical protein